MIVDGKNISMIRGDSETITLSCVDINGIQISLVAGDTVYFTVKENEYMTVKIFQKIITSFTDGKAIINIIPTDTKELKFKTYKYDVQLSRADGTVTTIIPPSLFSIEGEVTYE